MINLLDFLPTKNDEVISSEDLQKAIDMAVREHGDKQRDEPLVILMPARTYFVDKTIEIVPSCVITLLGERLE